LKLELIKSEEKKDEEIVEEKTISIINIEPKFNPPAKPTIRGRRLF
jgi:hypothetical protein